MANPSITELVARLEDAQRRFNADPIRHSGALTTVADTVITLQARIGTQAADDLASSILNDILEAKR